MLVWKRIRCVWSDLNCRKRHSKIPGLASKLAWPSFWPQANFWLLRPQIWSHRSFFYFLNSYIDCVFYYKDNIHITCILFFKVKIIVICQKFDWFLRFMSKNESTYLIFLNCTVTSTGTKRNAQQFRMLSYLCFVYIKCWILVLHIYKVNSKFVWADIAVVTSVIQCGFILLGGIQILNIINCSD